MALTYYSTFNINKNYLSILLNSKKDIIVITKYFIIIYNYYSAIIVYLFQVIKIIL
jgi:hypothetical protein